MCLEIFTRADSKCRCRHLESLCRASPCRDLGRPPRPQGTLETHRSGRGRGLLIVCCKRLKSTRNGKIFDVLWKKNIHKGECCATCSTIPFWDQVQLCIIECWKSSNNVILSSNAAMCLCRYPQRRCSCRLNEAFNN